MIDPGLVPVSIRRADRVVGLLDLDGIRLDEPFLAWTVRRLLETSPRRVSALDADAFFDAIGDEGVDPAAFIFHVGRCGSSVVVNALAAHPAIRVVSESVFVNGLTRAAMADPEHEAAHDRLARGIRYSSRCLAGETVPIIKTTSWNIALAPWLLARFPQARAIFVRRSRDAVVDSFVRALPGWAPPGVTGAEFAAAWDEADAIARSFPPRRTLTIDYERLASDPEAVIDTLVEHLGLEVSGPERDAMHATTRFDSKQRDRVFAPTLAG